MKSKLLIASALVVSGLGVAGTAAAAPESGNMMRETFSSKFAERFNLNKDEVQGYMREQHEARHAEVTAKATEALKGAGFSDEQITALQSKKEEQRIAHQKWHDENPDATKEQRKAHRDSARAELKTWASEQGIDLEKVRDTLKGSGVERGMHRGPRATDT
jgi:hypothetical protein